MPSSSTRRPGRGPRAALAVSLFLSGSTLIARGALGQARLRALLARERSARRELAVRETELVRANDRLGHLAGDQALRTVSAIVRRELRGGDRAHRYGGEEILIVLDGLDGAAARAAAERVRRAVEAAALPHPAGGGGVITLSTGIATGVGHAATGLEHADAALDAAKRDGRNRVVIADPPAHGRRSSPQARAPAMPAARP